MKSGTRPRPSPKRALRLNLIGGLLLLLLVLLAPHIAAAQFFTSPASLQNTVDSKNSPATDYFLFLPLISMPEKSSDRIGPITPLSASVPRYAKFQIAFTISTTATNLYFPYDPAAPYGESILGAPLGGQLTKIRSLREARAVQQTPCHVNYV